MSRSTSNKRAGSRRAGGQLRERVLVCGLGLRLAHMTLEAVQALKKCHTVFHDFLDIRTESHIRGLCPLVKDLRQLLPATSSEAMAGAVLAAAGPGRTVAFLCYGHPLVLQGTAKVLLRRCRYGKIPYRVIAGVSSIDEILFAAGPPILKDGLQIYPAYASGTDKWLIPSAPAVIMMLNSIWDPPGTGVADFIKHLKKIYPPGHPVLLLCCSNVTNNSALRLETDLAGLPKALNRLREVERCSASLLIPAL